MCVEDFSLLSVETPRRFSSLSGVAKQQKLQTLQTLQNLQIPETGEAEGATTKLLRPFERCL